jgi:hypothetical protein
MSVNDIEREAERINKMGDRLMKAKQYCEAITYYQESVDLMQQTGNRKKLENFTKELEAAMAGWASVLKNQSEQLFKQKQYREAMNTAQEAMALLQRAGQKWVKKYFNDFSRTLMAARAQYALEVLQIQAIAFADGGHWQEALMKYDEIMELVPKSEDPLTYDLLRIGREKILERWADAENHLGDELYAEKRFAEAIGHYSEAMTLINQTKNESKKKQYKTELAKAFRQHAKEINAMGDQLMKEKKYHEAAIFYEQSIALAKEGGLESMVANFTREMETAYAKHAQQINDQADQLFKLWKYQEAAELYERSINIAERSNQKKLIENFKKEYDNAVELWADQTFAQGTKQLPFQNWSKAMEFFKEAEMVIGYCYNNSKKEAFMKKIYRLYLEMARQVQEEAEVALNKKDFEKAYLTYDYCVMFSQMAQNDLKTKEFRKKRDIAMENWS